MGETAGVAPQLLVICMQWTEDGAARQETYGPWTIAGDESHLEQVSAFMRGWNRLKGAAVSAAMVILQDPRPFTEAGAPAAFPAGPDPWTPEQIAWFEARWNEHHAAQGQSSAT
jgi:hypothetical protein